MTSFSKYERQAIQRAHRVTLGKGRIRFAALEDVVIHKIVAGRLRDIEDVRGMLEKNPHYDGEYVLRWLTEFDRSLYGDFRGTFQALVKEIG